MSYLKLYFGTKDLTKIYPRLFVGFFNCVSPAKEAINVFGQLRRICGVEGIDASLFYAIALYTRPPFNEMAIKELKRRRASPGKILEIERIIKKEAALKEAKSKIRMNK